MKKEDADRIALAYVKAMEARDDNRLALLNELTIERSFGWVYFYNSQRYIETDNISDSLVGNAPFALLKDGSIRVTGTAQSLEYYLKALAGC